jgi:predicted dehydrogenase
MPPAHYVWDTGPGRSAGDPNRIVFIAGYHHTHADLAVDALDRGQIAVVEKPVVVDRAQLARLSRALRGTAGRFFTCFHKRYSPLNAPAIADLGAGAAPISYHCIVYEVPLPPQHWYRWPASRTKIVSNGCHWLDHFLWLNGYAPVRRHELVLAGDGTVNVSVELDNDAFFTMVLTHRGADRIGVQDYVELRAGDRTVRIVNNARYEAETPRRILRRKRVNRMQSYTVMYASIGRAILDGTPGDTLTSLEVGATLMLDLDDALGSHSRIASRPVAMPVAVTS